MESAYPLVPLSDVMHSVQRPIVPKAGTLYRQVGVRLWGAGAYEREIMDGGSTQYKTLFQLETDDLVVNKIWARNGSVAIVPKELAGAVVSGEFPTYSAVKSMLEPRWMHWITKTPWFWKQCDDKSQGTSGKNRIRPEQFLSARIPLPPLLEQQRIVTRIEALAGKIGEANRLKAEGLRELRALLIALARREDLTDEQRKALGWRKVTLGAVMRQVQDLFSVHADDAYPNLGIYSFGRGLFAKPPILGISSSATVLNRVRSGQFIYSRLFAFEGSYGYVSEAYDGRYVSAEYPTFDCDPEQIRAEFLNAYFMCPDVWSIVAQGSKGLGDRRQRVQPAQVLSHELWLPPMAQQNQVATILRKTSTLTEHQTESTKELDALLPAVLDRAFRGQLLAV